MNTTYNLLLADVDGTLLDFNKAEANALAIAFAEAGLSITAEHLGLYHEINEALWRAYERHEVTQDALRILRFLRLLEAIGETRDPAEMSEAFIRGLSLQTDEEEGAYDFLAEASKRVPVILVTNGISAVQRSRFQLSRLAQFLSGYVISGEVGFAKPDPRMIEAALVFAGKTDARPLMLGDEPRADIAAANAAGIASCWYNPAARQNDTPHLPTHEVHCLKEVLPWLMAN